MFFWCQKPTQGEIKQGEKTKLAPTNLDSLVLSVKYDSPICITSRKKKTKQISPFISSQCGRGQIANQWHKWNAKIPAELDTRRPSESLGETHLCQSRFLLLGINSSHLYPWKTENLISWVYIYITATMYWVIMTIPYHRENNESLDPNTYGKCVNIPESYP